MSERAYDEVYTAAPVLTEFFYLLARDHLPTGTIRNIISSHLQHSPEKERVFSDEHLAEWARARAEEIFEIERRANTGVIDR